MILHVAIKYLALQCLLGFYYILELSPLAGNVYTIVDYFICEYQSSVHHRPQCAIILNELVNFHVRHSKPG